MWCMDQSSFFSYRITFVPLTEISCPYICESISAFPIQFYPSICLSWHQCRIFFNLLLRIPLTRISDRTWNERAVWNAPLVQCGPSSFGNACCVRNIAKKLIEIKWNTRKILNPTEVRKRGTESRWTNRKQIAIWQT